MRKIYSTARFTLVYCGIILGLSGCFTVHTHQTAKTLGKAGFKKTIISGLNGVPNFSGEEVTYRSGGIMFPNYTYQYGVGEYSDVGAYLGITKMGGFFKHQLLGDKHTKGAFSIGANAFVGLDQFLFVSSLGYIRTEIPFYLSYDFSQNISIYSSPMLAYTWVREENFYQEPSRYHYLTRGLTIGFMLNLGEKCTISPEIAMQNLWNTRQYQFYTTIGFGIKLSQPVKLFRFPF